MLLAVRLGLEDEHPGSDANQTNQHGGQCRLVA
jgi:hypothetical protein